MLAQIAMLIVEKKIIKEVDRKLTNLVAQWVAGVPAFCLFLGAVISPANSGKMSIAAWTVYFLHSGKAIEIYDYRVIASTFPATTATPKMLPIKISFVIYCAHTIRFLKMNKFG